MPVLSLPSKYGCGDFGKVAYEFVDKIAKAGFSIWQILPLQPLGYGESPYQPYSSKAMDELYISLDMLVDDGLLLKNEVKPFCEEEITIKYQEVRKYKNELLKIAYSRFKPTKEFLEFKELEWVNDYAIFLTFKKENELRSWQDWDNELKFYPEDKNVDLEEYREKIDYEIFIQYLLTTQWNNLRKYANKKGLKIMGDVPFYVGLDSEDVWWNKDSFLLGDDARPTFIAGVPPDSFSATGQRWGNPIYDWERIEETGFKFWLDRLHFASEIYNIVRIDHFRAFSTFWKIPSWCDTAMEGEWIEAPGYKLFETLFKTYPDINIVAEDLGDNMDDVYVLRDHFDLKGMVITQQMFDGLNFGDTGVKSIAYTGTHDNDTIEGWFNKMDPVRQLEVIKGLYDLGYKNGVIADAMVEFTLTRSAETAILPVCDILRLSSNARINAPGQLSTCNWAWRLTDFESLDEELPRIKKLLKETNRTRA